MRFRKPEEQPEVRQSSTCSSLCRVNSITAVIPISKFEEGHYLMMATRKGLVKKTPIQDYANVRKIGLAAIITSR